MKPWPKMLTTYSLQWSLFRHQARQIERAVGKTSAAFQRYEREYQRATRTFRKELTRREVEQRVCEADIVYVGDYHTLKQAQDTYLELVDAAHASGRRVVLAVEFIEGRHQPHVDRFSSNRLSLTALAARVGYRPSAPLDLWHRFAPILEHARRHHLGIVAIDRRATGARSLQQRDAYAATRIAEAASQDDRPLVLVLVGQYHVAPMHLPLRVNQALGATHRTPLIVYQNAEGPFWKLAKQGRVASVAAVEVSERVVSLITAAPIVAQRSFLNYVESEPSVEDDTPHETFAHVALQLGKLAKVPVRRSLDDVFVATPERSDVFEVIALRGGYERGELARLKRLLLESESGLLGRARCVWLQATTMPLVTREAARLVVQTSGARPAADGTSANDFWLMCFEELFVAALVSSLLPAKDTPTLEVWSQRFRGSTADRATAAFILALASASKLSDDAIKRLTPTRDRTLMREVARGLGALCAQRIAPARIASLLATAPEQGPALARFCLALLGGSDMSVIASRQARAG